MELIGFVLGLCLLACILTLVGGWIAKLAGVPLILIGAAFSHAWGRLLYRWHLWRLIVELRKPEPN